MKGLNSILLLFVLLGAMGSCNKEEPVLVIDQSVHEDLYISDDLAGINGMILGLEVPDISSIVGTISYFEDSVKYDFFSHHQGTPGCLGCSDDQFRDYGKVEIDPEFNITFQSQKDTSEVFIGYFLDGQGEMFVHFPLASSKAVKFVLRDPFVQEFELENQ